VGSGGSKHPQQDVSADWVAAMLRDFFLEEIAAHGQGESPNESVDELKKLQVQCGACGGTGVYHGFAEPKGIGVVCLYAEALALSWRWVWVQLVNR
jgi:hypothetical protein